MNKLSNQEIKNLIELEKRATLGPWNSDQCGAIWTTKESEYSDFVGDEIFRQLMSTRYAPDDPNGIFVVEIRNAAPSLLAEVLELRKLQHEVGYLEAYFAGQLEIVLHKNDVKELFEQLNKLRGSEEVEVKKETCNHELYLEKQGSDVYTVCAKCGRSCG